MYALWLVATTIEDNGYKIIINWQTRASSIITVPLFQSRASQNTLLVLEYCDVALSPDPTCNQHVWRPQVNGTATKHS